MKDCEKHCDHCVGTKQAVGAGHIRTYRCCHCGREREEYVPPPKMSGGVQYSQQENQLHGPFAPEMFPRW